MIAYDPSGQPIAGGRYELPDGAMIGGLGGGVPGGPRQDLIPGATGLLYLFVHGGTQPSSLMALDGGRVAAGWPVRTVAADAPRAVQATTDGGLAVVYLDPATDHLAVTRFLSSGAIATGP